MTMADISSQALHKAVILVCRAMQNQRGDYCQDAKGAHGLSLCCRMQGSAGQNCSLAYRLVGVRQSIVMHAYEAPMKSIADVSMDLSTRPCGIPFSQMTCHVCTSAAVLLVLNLSDWLVSVCSWRGLHRASTSAWHA